MNSKHDVLYKKGTVTIAMRFHPFSVLLKKILVKVQCWCGNQDPYPYHVYRLSKIFVISCIGIALTKKLNKLVFFSYVYMHVYQIMYNL